MSNEHSSSSRFVDRPRGCDKLLSRLTAALHGIEATRPDAARILTELDARYAEPHRAYHTMAHIESCLAWFDWFRGQARRPAEIELALWFHDAVYDPRRSDNEHLSAQLAVRSLERCGVPMDRAKRVAALIESTRGHADTEGDAALLAAIDLTVLGAQAEEFARYEKHIRAEYAHVPESAYRAGRTAVLRDLVQRERVFPHPLIAEELEARARGNIELALNALCWDEARVDKAPTAAG